MQTDVTAAKNYSGKILNFMFPSADYCVWTISHLFIFNNNLPLNVVILHTLELANVSHFLSFIIILIKPLTILGYHNY